MFNHFSLISSIVLVELCIDYIVCKLFRLKVKALYLCLLQIPKLCVAIFWFSFPDKILCSIAALALSKIICAFFMSDSLSIKKISKIFFAEIVFLFSIGGFIQFLVICFRTTINDVFLQNYSKNGSILFIIAIFLYIFALFRLVKYLEKNRIINQHLAKVSFFLFGKHIRFYGLVDSGNTLVDPQTKKQVVIVSYDSLKKFLSVEELEKLLSCSKKIKCETISGAVFEIPIFFVKKFDIILRDCEETTSCFVGITKSKISGGKFDCLLHQDFL